MDLRKRARRIPRRWPWTAGWISAQSVVWSYADDRRQFGLSEVHIFSPIAVNSLRLGWNRFSQFQKGRDADVDPATIGLNTGVGPESFGIPEFDIGGSGPGRYSNLGLQYGAGGRVATTFQVADDFSLTHGAHAFKFGFNFFHDYSNYTIVGSRGLFTFDGSQLGTGLVANLTAGGHDL